MSVKVTDIYCTHIWLICFWVTFCYKAFYISQYLRGITPAILLAIYKYWTKILRFHISSAISSAMLGRFLFLGICVLVDAKPSEFTSLAKLNNDEILFERENCLLFLFSMTAEDTKVWTLLKQISLKIKVSPSAPIKDSLDCIPHSCNIMLLKERKTLYWQKQVELITFEKFCIKYEIWVLHTVLAYLRFF